MIAIAKKSRTKPSKLNWYSAIYPPSLNVSITLLKGSRVLISMHSPVLLP
ncbi:hypothetical protein H220_4714 [Klebsiella pneumoniae UHKPC61]|nr:hypothetical protein H220_4714 [Klebsiella pneumoniae UHKPC61]KGT67198.1 hypothetical protein T643_A5331 [Klebsiella pneumoniae MRSN 1319]